MKNQAAFSLIAALLLHVPLVAQNGKPTQFSMQQEAAMDLHRTIELDNDSKPAEITLSIKPGERSFDLSIFTMVSEGKLAIEVYDPNKTKQGSFTVGTQLDAGKKELVRGNLEKSWIEPIGGDWKVKIIPSYATGRIEIHTLTAVY